MSIAAVVLGGTLLSGGKGSIVGTLAGVGIFAVLDNVMSVMELNPFLKDVVRGIVIVVAVAVYARREIDRRPTRFGPRRPGGGGRHERADRAPRVLPVHEGGIAAAAPHGAGQPGWRRLPADPRPARGDHGRRTRTSPTRTR